MSLSLHARLYTYRKKKQDKPKKKRLQQFKFSQKTHNFRKKIQFFTSYMLTFKISILFFSITNNLTFLISPRCVNLVAVATRILIQKAVTLFTTELVLRFTHILFYRTHPIALELISLDHQPFPSPRVIKFCTFFFLVFLAYTTPTPLVLKLSFVSSSINLSFPPPFIFYNLYFHKPTFPVVIFLS